MRCGKWKERALEDVTKNQEAQYPQLVLGYSEILSTEASGTVK
jgi:hypothetical protein